MHIFLTGAVGCGKSTLVDKVISRAAVPVGGFRTGFGVRRGETERTLYLWRAGDCPRYDEAHTVARFNAYGTTPLPVRFDALGCDALSRSEAALIIMDECGRLEQEAGQFHSAVLGALDGAVPVLGVVRNGLPGWTKTIEAHPKVEVIEVTEENRDRLAGVILKKLGL